MKTPKTHFEQIPVETVKKIARLETSSENNRNGDVMRTSQEPGWRDLAEQVQREKDPGRMIALVQELISKLDERDSPRKDPPRVVDSK